MKSKTKSPILSDVNIAPRVPVVRVLLIVLLLTIISAAIRFYKLGEWSFWVDEMFTLKDALDPARGFHGMTYPLSYILIGASMHHFGVSEWAARLVPAIFGIATPAMVYLLSRKQFGEVPSIIAAALIAISPWHLYWSQMARFYTMTVFFSTASILMLHKAFEENKKWYAAAAGVLMVLATLSHYSALLTFIASIVYVATLKLLKWPKPAGFNRMNLLIYFGPFILGAIAVGAKAVALLSIYAGGHPTGTKIANPVNGALYMIFSIIYRLEPAAALLGLTGAWIGISRRDRSTLIALCGAVIPAALLVIAGAMSHAENRYAFVMLPPAALLAGTAVSAIWSTLREKSRVIAFAACLSLALPLLQHDMSYFSKVSNGERWNYRASADYLKSHAKKGDVVYSAMPFSLAYYLQGTGIEVKDLNIGKGISYPEKGSWLVMEDSTRGTSVPRELHGWIEKNCTISANFSASSATTDYGLTVYRRQ